MKLLIHDGRYGFQNSLPVVAPPIQIFHPIFERFTQLLGDPLFQPEIEDLLKTRNLMHLLSSIGDQESARNCSILNHLSEMLEIGEFEISNQDTSKPDGISAIRVDGVYIPLFLLELQEEFGEGGCDPSTQAGLSMRRSWIQHDVGLTLVTIV